MRKLSLLLLAFVLVVGAQWVAPRTASACDDWQGFNQCWDAAEARYASCHDSCFEYGTPYGFSSICGDRCYDRFYRETCYCQMYCDPYVWCF
jgi:hypothetical protein